MPFGLMPGNNLTSSAGMEGNNPSLSPQMSSAGKSEPWWKRALPYLAGAGGTALSSIFGPEAAGNFAQGFAKAKLDQTLTKRQNDMEYENFQIKNAHAATKDLAGIDYEALKGKVPEVALQKARELTAKFNESLLNDGKISPKEAAEIMALRQGLEPHLAAMKNAQEQTNTITNAATQGMARREAEVGDIQTQLAYGGVPLSQSQEGDFLPGPDPEQIQNRMGDDGLRGRAISEWAQRNSPIKVDVGGQMVSLPAEKAHIALQEVERSKRAESAERARNYATAARIALGNLSAATRMKISAAGLEGKFISDVVDFAISQGLDVEDVPNVVETLARRGVAAPRPAGAPKPTKGLPEFPAKMGGPGQFLGKIEEIK